jgi:hypothetical protein
MAAFSLNARGVDLSQGVKMAKIIEFNPKDKDWEIFEKVIRDEGALQGTPKELLCSVIETLKRIWQKLRAQPPITIQFNLDSFAGKLTTEEVNLLGREIGQQLSDQIHLTDVAIRAVSDEVVRLEYELYRLRHEG